MKKHLLTAALAIVALGGAVVSTANSNTGHSKNLVDITYYENPGCTPVVCGDYDTEECSNLVLFNEGCQTREFNPIGNRKAE